MSSNKEYVFAFLAGVLTIGKANSTTTEVCPVRPGHPLKYGGPFDGTPEENASLVPDKAGKRFGYWELAYVYDAGRFVTFQCEYPDGKIINVRLEHRIRRCEYTVSKSLVLKIVCK